MENRFTELEEATFLSSQPLVHFIESPHRISRESILFGSCWIQQRISYVSFAKCTI
jgi:hypothetical protein